MSVFYSSKTPNNAVAYLNGRIYTVDEALPWASGFIVSPLGRFEFVGSSAETEAIAKRRGLMTFNLRQRFVMPGLHDAHTHFFMGGLKNLYQAGLAPDTDHETLAPTIRDKACACDRGNVAGDWVISSSYHPGMFPDGVADRKYLDAVYADRPVLVRDMSAHKVLLNTAGLRRIGLDPEHPAASLGPMYCRRADGSLTGQLMEDATTDALLSVPMPPLASVKRALAYGVKECHRHGITSVQEASANTLYMHALRELDAHGGGLQLDMHPHVVHGNECFGLERQHALASLLDDAQAFRSEHVDPRFVKFFLDGVPLLPDPTNARLDADGEPDAAMLLLDDDVLFDAVAKYDARGMTCKMHAAGEGSTRQALRIYERVRQQNPNGPRHEIAHCNAVLPADIPLFASLRVTAEMSPAIFHVADALESHPPLLWRFDDLHAAGAICTVGTDWPMPDSPSLFPTLTALVGKLKVDPVAVRAGQQAKTEDKTPQQLSGEIICRMITLGAAEALGTDDKTGSIAVGKKANFIMVDRDLSRGEFDGASVLKTWFMGDMVWDADGPFRTSV